MLKICLLLHLCLTVNTYMVNCFITFVVEIVLHLWLNFIAFVVVNTFVVNVVTFVVNITFVGAYYICG